MSRRKQSNPKPLKWDDESGNDAEDGDGRPERKVGPGVPTPSVDEDGNSRDRESVGGESSNHPSSESPGKQMECGSRKRRDLNMDYPISKSLQQQHRQDGRKDGSVWQKSPHSHRKYHSGMSGHHQPSSIDSRTSPEMDTEDEPLALHLYHGGGGGDSRKSDGRRSETPEMPNDLNGSGPFSHQRIIQAGLPYLHLLPPAMRNDAARLFFMPPILPPELAAAAVAATSGQPQPLSANNAKLNEKAVSSGGDNCRSGPVYMCEPCNIKFSSTRTLEAHQTYYCSFRKDTGKDDKNDLDGDSKSERDGSTPNIPNAGSKKRERMSSGEDRGDLSLDDLRQDGLSMVDGSGVGNVNKSVKTGKLYACIYCSYSADKKVSLNRHMRMHSGPAPSSSIPNNATSITVMGSNSVSLLDDSMGSGGGRGGEEGGKTDGANAMERYCSDCDIQFSSIKTFRVHKQYYCSTRHVLKAQQLAAAAAVAAVSTGSSSSSNSQKQSMEMSGGGDVGLHHRVINATNSPIPPSDVSPIPSGTPLGSQPFVVLPTNPVIIVPAYFIQGASILPSNVLPTQNALVVLPNGSVQCLPATNPCPSPQSMANLVMSLQHSSANNINTTSNSLSAAVAASGGASLSPVFNDPKDIIRDIRKICGTAGGGGTISTSTPLPVSRNSSDESSNEPHSHSQSSGGGGGGGTMCSNLVGCNINVHGGGGGGVSGQDINSDIVSNSESVTGTIISRSHHRSQSSGGEPAIDLTLRSTAIKREAHGDDEKENLGVIYTIHQSDMMSRELMNNSPSERLSVGSGSGSEKKRTPRPSSASISSSCSTPPALCEPKLNGILSRVSPGPSPLDRNHLLHHPHHTSGGKKSSSSHHHPHHHQHHSSSSSNKGIDYSVLEMSKLRSSSSSSASTNCTNIPNPGRDRDRDRDGGGGGDNKISPIATQLPGGAILTSASNQSLAELLLSNPPELNESLAKLNPQLLINSRAAAASGTGFNPALMGGLTPELALRFLDPSYLATLQHSLQQQQQQLQQQQQQQQPQSQSQQQGTPPTVKRGVSKCIECDIVFYRFENYLVHKEHYCAARLTNTSGGGSSSRDSFPTTKNSKDVNQHGAKESASSSCSSPKSELDDTVSPPPSSILNCSSVVGGRKNSIRSSISSNVSLLRRSPDDCGEDSKTGSLRGRVKSPSSLTVSPIASPSSIKSEKLHGATQSLGKGSDGQSERYPCLKCGIQYSSLDTLQTHQTFYCRKRGGGIESLSNSCGPVVMVDGGVEGRGKGERGFVKCPKCRLAVPDDQMNLHSQVCSGGRNGASTGSISTTTMGWKCPCCETYSPTMSAAQKHLETHTGIRAFKCLLCGYRGNTLRGMRTHIRMHFDKRISSADLQEGDYIACITANNELESSQQQTASNSLLIHSCPHNTGGGGSSTGQSLSPNPSQNASPSSSTMETHHGSSNAKNASPRLPSPLPPPSVISNSEVVTKAIKTTGPPPPFSSSSPPPPSSSMEKTDDRLEEGKGAKLENNNRLHFCTLCNYSSSYKGNVVRHMKLVHKISEESADEIVSASSGNSREQDYTSNSHDSFTTTKDIECSGDNSTKNPGSPPTDYDPINNIKTNCCPKLPVNGIGESQSSSNSNNKNVVKEEEDGDQPGIPERHRSSSRSSSEEDLTTTTTTNSNISHSKKKKEDSCGVQYCKSCNIYFNYPATFVAHKKFYCSSHVPSDTTEAVERAETPVQ